MSNSKRAYILAAMIGGFFFLEKNICLHGGQTLKWAHDLILSEGNMRRIRHTFRSAPHCIAAARAAQPTKKKKTKKQPLIIFFIISLQQSLFVSFPTFA
jgi:hypothetical protein